MQLHHLLSLPRFYSGFADLAGGSARATYAREYIRAGKSDRILDIGCGPGDILKYLPADVRYTGFDADAAYIAAARERFGARGEFFCRPVTPELLREFSEFRFLIYGVLLILMMLFKPEGFWPSEVRQRELHAEEEVDSAVAAQATTVRGV